MSKRTAEDANLPGREETSWLDPLALAEAERALNAIRALIPGWKRGKFPAPQPVSVSRKHLITVRASRYYVCEKSDGETSCLFTLDANVYLMNRKCIVKRVRPDSEAAKALLLLFGSHTCVVGEWLPEQNSFRMFDVLMHKRRGYTQSKFEARLQVMWSLFERGTPDGLPFDIRVKKFALRNQAKSLIVGCIRKLPGVENKYWYDDGKRSNGNDGTVLVPADNDYFCTLFPNQPILKHKWDDMNTIDYAICKPWFDQTGKLVLYSACQTLPITMSSTTPEFRLVVARKIAISGEEKSEIDKIIFQESTLTKHIVEMSYVCQESRWKFVGCRDTDKDTPNILETAISTLETIADHVTIEELLS